MFKKMLFFSAILFSHTLFAAKFPMPKSGNDLIGNLTYTRAMQGDTLSSIGERNGIGFHEMWEANSEYGQGELSGGAKVILPTQYVLPKYRKGIVINLAECRLFYFTPDGKSVLTYPVGLGREGWRTPTTSTTVIRKAANPDWTVPNRIHAFVYEQTGKSLPHVVHPGPENPLGPYAMYLGKNGYLIHGTNQPWSIGKLISAGCIRMYNQDVSELYKHVSTGTPVHIIHQPYKTGWQEGKLYIEAHIPIKNDEPASALNMISLEESVTAAANKRKAEIDWNKVQAIAKERNGMPEPIDGHTMGSYNYYTGSY